MYFLNIEAQRCSFVNWSSSYYFKQKCEYNLDIEEYFYI